MRLRMQMGRSIMLGLLICVMLATPVLADELSENGLLQYGGGGLFTELMHLNVSGLNSVLAEGEFGTLNDWMVTYGGGLFSQTKHNFRYSNFFAKGKLVAEGVSERSATLSLTHGGVWLDQILPLVPDLAVSAGEALSLGGMKLTMIHHQASSFAEGVQQPQETVATVPFFIIKPEVGIHYSIKRYLDFELKAGYYYSHILGGWKQGGGRIPGSQPFVQSHGVSVLMHLNFGF